MNFVHTDADGMACSCDMCKQVLKEPAVQIASRVTQAGKTELYVASWHISYKLYCSDCAFKHMVNSRTRRPRFITKLLIKLFTHRCKKKKETNDGTGI